MKRTTLAAICSVALLLVGALRPWSSSNPFLYLTTIPIAVFAVGFLLEMAKGQ